MMPPGPIEAIVATRHNPMAMNWRPKADSTERPRGQDENSLRFPWSRSERPVPRLVLRPLQAFLETEASGGALVLAAAAAALAWANSPWSRSYEALWHTELTLSLGPWTGSLDLRHWINEGLMTIFFFVVGLEIKRELTTGELRDPRAAALPAIGAVGGMLVPALLYAALNAGGNGSRGWGIPMANDIAFALGVLAIVGRRLPTSLRSFLLALAIVDDIGAILIIAVFYSGPVSWIPLGLAGALLLVIFALQRLHFTWPLMYWLLGVAVWATALRSGIHPTIAGVALGLLTPSVPFQRPRAVSDEAHRVADDTEDDPFPADADAHHWLRLAELSREAVSPLARLESALHPWTSFLIVPLFALANAGVDLGGGSIAAALGSRIALGIVVGLVVGKTVGITLAAWAAVRVGLAKLPESVRWGQVFGISAVAGIGFTVALFIADLAFVDPAAEQTAKVGILGASLLAGLLGGVLLTAVTRTSPSAGNGPRS